MSSKAAQQDSFKEGLLRLKDDLLRFEERMKTLLIASLRDVKSFMKWQPPTPRIRFQWQMAMVIQLWFVLNLKKTKRSYT
ncbi:unnamed protein product [Linum trigynum]|uniref:Uncharacterized protein n=1 Tax=Linum trigynum TaxID=586398 RepID=A0AAV2FB43_9ROSI